MYRSASQRGRLTVFFSCGSKPLDLWDVHIKNGYVSRFLDQDIKSSVVEIGGTNVSTAYMICPKGNKVLGISMPYLVMIVKNLKKYFSFEVTVLDETGTRRRFRVSNFQSTTQIQPLCTVMPISLSEGWNQIQFNLPDFMERAYKKQFIEVQKLKINANIRLRRIYFTEKLLPEEELPPEYKLFFPLGRSGAKNKKAVKETPEVKVEKSVSIQGVKPLSKAPSATAELAKTPSGKIEAGSSLEKKKSEEKAQITKTTSVQNVTEQAETGTAPEQEKAGETEQAVPHSEPGEIFESEGDIEPQTENKDEVAEDPEAKIDPEPIPDSETTENPETTQDHEATDNRITTIQEEPEKEAAEADQ